jgi:hypothetical protein
MDEDKALDLALEALKIARDQIVDPEYAPIGWNVSRLDEVLSIGKQARALDKKAENARELGLDYEPIECPVCKAEDSPYPKCGCVRYVDPPAQRQWVGLTDEEIENCVKCCRSADGLARDIEAKLKEKNCADH